MSELNDIIDQINYLNKKDTSLDFKIVDYFCENGNNDRNVYELKNEPIFSEYSIEELTNCLKRLNNDNTLKSFPSKLFSCKTIAEANAGYQYYLNDKVQELHEFIKNLTKSKGNISPVIEASKIIEFSEKLKQLINYLDNKYFEKPVENIDISNLYNELFNNMTGLYNDISQRMRSFIEKSNKIKRKSQSIIKNIDIGALSEEYAKAIADICGFAADLTKIARNEINKIIKIFTEISEKENAFDMNKYYFPIYNQMTVLNKGIGEEDKINIIESIKNVISSISYSEITNKGVFSKIISQVIDTIQNLLFVRTTILNSRKIIKTKKFFIELAEEFNKCNNEIELKRLFDSYFSTKEINYYTCGGSCSLSGNEIIYKIPKNEKRSKKERKNISKEFSNSEKEQIIDLKQEIKNMIKKRKILINNLFLNNKLINKKYTTDEFNFLLNVYHTSTFVEYIDDNNSKLSMYRDKYIDDLKIYIKISNSDFNTIWISPNKKRTYFNKNVEVWCE